MTALISPLALDAMLVESAFIENPYPAYALLRAHAPVHESEAWGAWLLTRYDDCAAVLRDPERFSSAGRVSAMLDRLPAAERARFAPLDANFQLGMPNSDPPDHTRIRNLVNRAFTPRVVEAMQDEIGSALRELLAPVLTRGEVDLIPAVAHPLPARVILSLLGVPRADRARFQQWSNDVVAFFGTAGTDLDTATRSLTAFLEAREWLRDAIAESRRRPRSDLLTALVLAESESGALTEAEIIATCITLLTAGHETTTTLIASGCLALLRHPDQLALLRERPELISSAIEEFLRYDAPFQQARRRTSVDVEIRGRRIPAGSIVSELLGSANRDPEQFADPDRLDITRHGTRHLGFGVGIHFCIGAALARLEARIAIPMLLDELRDVELSPDGVAWRWNTTFRGLSRLVVRFAPRMPVDGIR
ncbi:MAG: hypothetical protein QOH08_398 [Chloroflexota bacterium]|nr:hypothetical protein [Chloroflexota bacterium]